MTKYVCDLCGNDKLKTITRPITLGSKTKTGVECFMSVSVCKITPKKPMSPDDMDVCAECVIELIKTSVTMEQQKP